MKSGLGGTRSQSKVGPRLEQRAFALGVSSFTRGGSRSGNGRTFSSFSLIEFEARAKSAVAEFPIPSSLAPSPMIFAGPIENLIISKGTGSSSVSHSAYSPFKPLMLMILVVTSVREKTVWMCN